jgi:hypothetical protein
VRNYAPMLEPTLTSRRSTDRVFAVWKGRRRAAS